jgi:beta-catenin-like protein 1
MFKVPAKKQKLDEPEVAKDQSSLSKLIHKFEIQILINTTLRQKHPKEPLKYIDSEADLSETLKELTQLSSLPQLYHFMLGKELHFLLLSLLEHENTDIAIQSIKLINELFEEDDKQDQFLELFITNHLLTLIKQLLERLNFKEEDDKEGIFICFELLETIISIDPSLSTPLYELINTFLLSCITLNFDSIKQYAIELLSVILQNSTKSRMEFIKNYDVILEELAKYRKKDLIGDEEEYVENLFDILCITLQLSDSKLLFIKAQGIELMFLMIKYLNLIRAKRFCTSRALKCLDYFIIKSDSNSCREFIDKGGLKICFPLFNPKRTSKGFVVKDQQEHLLSILSNLFQFLYKKPEIGKGKLVEVGVLDKQDAYMQRVIYKFMENSFEMLHFVILLYTKTEHEQFEEDYLERLENGLYLMQMAAICILYLAEILKEVLDC